MQRRRTREEMDVIVQVHLRGRRMGFLGLYTERVCQMQLNVSGRVFRLSLPNQGLLHYSCKGKTV